MKSMTIIVLLVGLLAVTGCARGITQKNARSQCLTWSGVGLDDEPGYFCLERDEICAANFTGNELEELNRIQCFAHCDQVKSDQRKLHPVDGCEALVNKAWSLCRAYCSSKPSTP